METLYFAYGSNLSRSRLLARVPSARTRGRGCLPGYRLVLDKRSRDGSAKANLQLARDQRVFGAVYRLSAIHWPALDACEPGYRRIEVELETRSGRLAAQTYISHDLTPRAVAYDWYKQLLLDGAAEHGLPARWQHFLRALPSRSHDGGSR